MGDPLTPARDDQLLRCIPDIFSYKTLLHIGAQVKDNWPIFRDADKFEAAGYEMDIIEIWDPNYKALKELNEKGRRFHNCRKPPGVFRCIYKGDISNEDHLKALPRYDVIQFWHGPEHLPFEKIPGTLKRLLLKTLKILVISTPCGKHNREMNNNPYEAHRSTLTAETFKRLGFKTDLVGVCGEPGNNLLAWITI